VSIQINPNREEFGPEEADGSRMKRTSRRRKAQSKQELN